MPPQRKHRLVHRAREENQRKRQERRKAKKKGAKKRSKTTVPSGPPPVPIQASPIGAGRGAGSGIATLSADKMFPAPRGDASLHVDTKVHAPPPSSSATSSETSTTEEKEETGIIQQAQSIISSPTPVATPSPADLERIEAETNRISGAASASNAKEAKRLRNRFRIFKELVTTEQTYVDQLAALIELYVSPLDPSLSGKTNRIIKPKQHSALFPDVKTLMGLNSNLLNTLEERLSTYNPKTTKIGDEFIRFAPYFMMYQNYVNNHEQASSTLHGLQANNSSFNEFCDKQQLHPKAKSYNLESFLILPIQRVPRYELCFRELLKFTKASHCDYEDIQSAMSQISKVNKTINERMKDYASRETVKKIEQRFGGAIKLVAPSRTFIKEGYMKKVCRKKDVKYLFLLLSDLLIYCTGEKGTGKLNLHHQLPLDEYFRIVDVENNRKYGNLCFEVHSTIKSFLVYTDDAHDKKEWVTKIQQCLDLQADSRARKRKNQGGSPTVGSADDFSSTMKVTAPVWFPDDFSDQCMNPSCLKKFTTFGRRRHHCRYCGRLVCGDCSSHKLPNPNREEVIVRVCDMCYASNKMLFPDYVEKVHKKKNSFFSSSGKSPKGASWTDADDDAWDDSDSDNGSEYSASGSMSVRSVGGTRAQKAAKRQRSFRGAKLSIASAKQVFSKQTAGNPPRPAMPVPQPRKGTNRRAPGPPRVTAGASPRSSPVSPHSGGLPPRHDSVSMSRSASTGANGAGVAGRPRLPSNGFPVSQTPGEAAHTYKAMLEVMQGKLDAERQKNVELQRTIKDLRSENARLRKSKVDLVTWANTEINQLRKQLKSQPVLESHND